jgi:hypothetical protein
VVTLPARTYPVQSLFLEPKTVAAVIGLDDTKGVRQDVRESNSRRFRGPGRSGIEENRIRGGQHLVGCLRWC